MKAIVINGCCNADELHISYLPIPEAKPGWVLIKIRAAGLNRSEALLRMFEADSDYIRTPIVPGIECVGEVVDPSDTSLHVGDRVVAIMGGMGRSFNGSYAEYVLAPAGNVFRVDAELDWVQLAAIPESYYTAYGSLVEGLRLEPGDTLLIRGATSTVGQAAIQLAKAIGATVIAGSRRESAFEPLRAIGADYCVVDDGSICRQPLPCRPNKALELVGPKTLPDTLQCVSIPGFVCSTGVLGHQFTIPHFDPIKYIPNGVYLTGFFSNYPTQQAIDRLFAWIVRASIKPLYARVFHLDEIAEAHRLLEEGTAGGKIILKIC